MKFGIFTIFSVFGIVSNWATKALEDGKVTLDEGLDLVNQLCECIGVVPELDIPALTPTDEEVIREAPKGVPDATGVIAPGGGDRAPPETTSLEFSDQAEEGLPNTAKEVTEL